MEPRSRWVDNPHDFSSLLVSTAVGFFQGKRWEDVLGPPCIELDFRGIEDTFVQGDILACVLNGLLDKLHSDDFLGILGEA